MTKEDARAYQRKWRQENPERWREIHRRSNKKHRQKYNAVEKAWRARNKTRVQGYGRKRNLSTYGITPEQYDALFASQKGCCAICERHQTEFKRRLNVDHNHASGKLRRLLCGDCNLGLGCFHDNPELLHRAAAYLRNEDS